MEQTKSKEFDVIIIGGGAAGISAAVWCDELGLKAMLLERGDELGGQLLWTHNAIKNYLGVETANGREMRDIFVKQIQSRNFQLKTKSEVVDVSLEDKTVKLNNNEILSAKTLIIAAGVSRRNLGIKGENEFKGCGIIESGARDSHLVKGKRVAVVGGGDAALENALILAEKAVEVILIHRRKDFRARPEFIERILKAKKIKILTEIVVAKIIGSQRLEALELKDIKTSKIITLDVGALLVRIGVEPNTRIFQGNLKMDKNGYIKTDSQCETSVKNVFAVGDAANPSAPTISSAVGMGATAAKMIFKRLR